MTPAQRRQLIEKRQQGTLNDEESRQYLDLLRTDPSFCDDVHMHTLLTDVVREDSDQALWAAVTKARAKAPRRTPVLDSIRHYPYAYAIAACVALLLVGAWLFWPLSNEPQLVKVETNYLFRADRGDQSGSGLGYARGDLPIGKLPIKWIKNGKLTTLPAYQYCRDTLTIFIQNDRDTLYLQNARLRYKPDPRSLSIDRPNHPPTTLTECQPDPLPF